MEINVTTRAINFTCVIINSIQIYFSYQTPISFYNRKTVECLVSQNHWLTTTGKHLNYIDGGNKKKRVPHYKILEAIANS